MIVYNMVKPTSIRSYNTPKSSINRNIYTYSPADYSNNKTLVLVARGRRLR
jgi:hypothetical protein